MIRDKKIVIAIIIVLLICIAGLGIAFAAFSQTLTIGGAAEVESSSWSVVFEGLTNPNTIDAPVLTGTAQEITHPTIKNNSSEISTFEATLKTPGDSITYNFKIHNKGDFAASISSLLIGDNGIRSYDPIYSQTSGIYLINDKDKYYDNPAPYNKIKYTFYYTLDNSLVGNNVSRDCLEPGETALVSLKLVFSSTDETDTSILPAEDIILDNLGISATYTQSNNGSCAVEMIDDYDGPFISIDYAYYIYEGKTFIGTSVNNIILSENAIGLAQYSSATPTDNGAGANPRYTYVDTPAIDMAEAYCTGCRIINIDEAISWCHDTKANSKCSTYYNGTEVQWWTDYVHTMGKTVFANTVQYGIAGRGSGVSVMATHGVRPAVSIPSTATMTGSGTKSDPYVITP